ncbi:MAG: ATP-binding protein [Phycisphaerales bacterium]
MTPPREHLGLKLTLLIGCIGLGCAVFGGLVWRMVDRIKVNGPLYAQIIVGKDVVADILPPPEYIIESYLTTMLLADASNIDQVDALAGRLQALEAEYEARQAYWSTHLEPGPMRELMLVRSRAPAARFFDLARSRLVPLMREGRRPEATALLRGEMAGAYALHRAAIDELVVRANAFAQATEAGAARELNSAYAPGLIATGSALLASMVAGLVWTLGRARSRAVQLAQAMTTDLAAAKDRAEAALREAQALRSTVDQHSIVSVTDTSGRIIDVNDLFCRISGYSREELIGQNHRILNSGYHPKAFWADMWRMVAGSNGAHGSGAGGDGQPGDGHGRPGEAPNRALEAHGAHDPGAVWNDEVCNRAKDGSLYWVDTIIAPFIGADGRAEKYVSIRTDITERKRAEQRLLVAHAAAQAASRAKSEFLANMSHEIRTPLTAILGFADLLREDGDITAAPSSRLQAIETINNAGQHLLAVINDILDLSKIEADRMTVEATETDLPAVLHDVVSLMQARADGKGVALSVVLTTPLPRRVLSDPTRLRQILMNLTGNAVKFTDAGAVTLRATVAAGDAEGPMRLVIDVEDTGAGMDAEQARQLFVAFGQADTTVTRKFGGTGLGLVISQRLARLMGGEVTLLRSVPGQGSCFRIDLPLRPIAGCATFADVAKPPVVPATATGESLKLTGHILLAEDGPDNQRLISFHLKKAGATIGVADNGRIALEMLDAAAAAGRPYDLLLTDMQMPEMDGYTLAQTLRQRGDTLPIVALTAHALTGDRDRCLTAGCNDYASKPIDKKMLIAACSRWMRPCAGEPIFKQAA